MAKVRFRDLFSKKGRKKIGNKIVEAEKKIENKVVDVAESEEVQNVLKASKKVLKRTGQLAETTLDATEKVIQGTGDIAQNVGSMNPNLLLYGGITVVALMLFR